MARIKMGLKSLDDDSGYRRGAKGIDGDKGHVDFHRVSDDGNKAQRDISGKYGGEFKHACDPWDEPTWKPGKVSSGGHYHSTNGPPQSPSNTKPVSAASPSGKYGKPGGKGQRSGA